MEAKYLKRLGVQFRQINFMIMLLIACDPTRVATASGSGSLGFRQADTDASGALRRKQHLH